jgi:hypothetical protein
MAALRDMVLGKQKTGGGFSPLSQAHRDRQALFAMFWNYYRGHHRKPLTVRQGSPDDNVILNLSKRVVNKGVQFLFGKSVDFEIDEDDGRTPEEQYLDEVWGTDEEKHTWLQQAGINGSVTGTAVARLYEPVPGVGFNLPRMVVIDPMLLDVVSAEDDVTDVRGYHIIWKSGDTWKRHRFDVQDNGEWMIAEEVARTNNVDWQLVNETVWPYPFAPIVTCQNLPTPNEFWGMSDLEEADINDAINFTASNIARILKFHAHPKTIGTGFAFNQLQNTAVDEFWTIPNEAAKVFNLEMQSDLASAYNYLQLLRATYAKVTGVPELDPENVNVGALSGFALRILYGDLLETTQTKRNTYGMFLSELNTRMLALGNMAEYGSMVVRNVWQDPLPSSGLEQAQTLQIDRNNGLSVDTYLTRRGYDVEMEASRRADETAQRATLGEELLRQFETGAQV